MTRKNVAIEGRPIFDGWLIENGALTWGPDPVSIYDARDEAEELGVATDFRREEGGMITADINIGRELDPTEILVIYVGKMTSHIDAAGVLRIQNGYISSLVIVGKLGVA